jgi:hypothetical protein
VAATTLAAQASRPARRARAGSSRTGRASAAPLVSTQPQPVTEQRPSDAISGFLSSVALFASLIGIAYRPVRIIPFALVLALIATAMGGRHQRLATAALIIGAVSFVVGMALAVITNNPVF